MATQLVPALCPFVSSSPHVFRLTERWMKVAVTGYCSLSVPRVRSRTDRFDYWMFLSALAIVRTTIQPKE